VKTKGSKRDRGPFVFGAKQVGEARPYPIHNGDGKRVLYRSTDANGSNLKWIASHDSECAGTTVVTAKDAYGGTLTSDGKWVVYPTADWSATSFRDI
jgi:hypothetical protein